MHAYLRDAMGTQMLGLRVWRDQAVLMPMAYDDVCIMLPPWAGAFIAVVDQRHSRDQTHGPEAALDCLGEVMTMAR